jgi:hypothetical protein
MGRETSSNEPQSAPAAALTTKQVAVELRRADIILTRGGGPVSWTIRRFTGSHWNHAAMVFVLSDAASGSQQGYQSTFILEAEAQGIDVHPIDKYLYEEKQDMVVLRFPDSILGFPESPDPDERRRAFRRRVRGFAFEEIDATYAYRTFLKVGEKTLGPLGCLLKPAIRTVKVAAFNSRKSINDFVCSGVVQYAYYRACYGADPDDGTRWDDFFQNAQNVGNLIVNAEMRAAFDPSATFDAVVEQLKMTTPADFSRAAQANLLECVAERVKGVWGKQLTKV